MGIYSDRGIKLLDMIETIVDEGLYRVWPIWGSVSSATSQLHAADSESISRSTGPGAMLASTTNTLVRISPILQLATT